MSKNKKINQEITTFTRYNTLSEKIKIKKNIVNAIIRILLTYYYANIKDLVNYIRFINYNGKAMAILKHMKYEKILEMRTEKFLDINFIIYLKQEKIISIIDVLSNAKKIYNQNIIDYFNENIKSVTYNNSQIFINGEYYKDWMNKQKSVISFIASNKKYSIKHNDENSDKIKEYEVMIDYLKKKINTLENKLSKQGKLEGKSLLFYKDLVEKFQKVDVNIKKVKPENSEANKEYIMLLSDFHVGEFVKPSDTLNMGNFNIKIFLARIKHIAERIIRFIDYKKERKIHLFLLGDIVSGRIHEELLQFADASTTDQIYIAAYSIIYLISEISPYFECVEINGVAGNHGRLTKKKQFKNVYDSFDTMTYLMVDAFFKAKNYKLNNTKINIDISNSWYFVKKIQNKYFFGSHGDNVKSYGGIPFYGIKRQINTVTRSTRKVDYDIDYIVLGHFHNDGAMEDYYTHGILNGSVMGANEFSVSLGLATPPSQKLLVVEEEYGLTTSYRIQLDYVDKYNINEYLGEWKNIINGILGDEKYV